MTLQEVFHQWRTELRTADYSVTRRIGTKFEDLCKIFLLHDSAYKDIYESVDPYLSQLRGFYQFRPLNPY